MESEEYRLIPGSNGFYISKRGYIKNKKSRSPNRILKPKLVGYQLRISIMDINNKRISLSVPKILLEVFKGEYKPNKNYGIRYRDEDPYNLELSNIYWGPYVRKSRKGIPNNVEGFRYKELRSCLDCKFYPCMERQKNGSSKFDFGAYGCVQYKKQ